MTHKTLTTEAKIKRIQQLMRQHQPTSKLYQSMAPQLQMLMVQFKVEQQEVARLKAIEAERQKAEAAEKKRQAAIAAEKARAKAEAKAAAEEKVRQAQIAAEKAKAEAKAKAEKGARQAGSAAEKAQTRTTIQPESQSRLLYHARGCLKATYTDGKLLWRGHQLDCSAPPWVTLKADRPLYFRVYPVPQRSKGIYRLSKFRVYTWHEHKPEDYEDGQFFLGGCWIYTSPVEAAAQRPIFRVYRNRRTHPGDKVWPLNLKLQWPEQEPLMLIPKKQPGWREQYNFYQIKANYNPEQQALVFTELLSGPARMPFALNYSTAKKKKKKKKKHEDAPTNAVKEIATTSNPEETASDECNGLETSQEAKVTEIT